jgi:hypothetical protein
MQGTKHDQDKVRMELLPPVALEEIAKVLTHGGKKYDDHNWRKGFKYSRLIGAALRHVFAFARGENLDPETGLSHLAHAACCMMFLIDHMVLGYGQDDRYNAEVKIPTPPPTEALKGAADAFKALIAENVKLDHKYYRDTVGEAVYKRFTRGQDE